MTITTEQHKQSFIDCIEAAILDSDVKLARSLIVECEVYSENSGVELLTLLEVIAYYMDLYEVAR
jgi:hypothetical protein